MTEHDILQYTLDQLKTAGIDDATCSLSKSTTQEMNVETGKLTLMRTVFNNTLNLYVIKDSCSGNYSINKLDKNSIDQAVKDVVDIANSSEPDPANAIAEYQNPGKFRIGKSKLNLDLMYDRFSEFLDTVTNKYPKIMLENAYFTFSSSDKYIANSNGIDFSVTKGIYRLNTMFSGNDGEDSSSFNYTGFATKNLDQPLLASGSLDHLLQQSSEQAKTQPFTGKFVGDIIITPDCLGDFLNYLFGITITDGALVSGTSIYKNSIGKQIADSNLTLHSRPVDSEIMDGYYITGDGYRAENNTIIDKGILKTFLLSLYGANKTGLDRAVNSGGCYVVEPGDEKLEQLIGKVNRGILLARYSGGNPSQNGDFSGVAKNSYYIENGKIQYPISETMVSGNLIDMLHQIKGISQERVDYGYGIYPWICCSGFTISGK